jgi:hypothetical protein
VWVTTVRSRRRLLDAAGLVLLTLFVLSYFDLSLVVLDTTLTGGDTLSQHGLAVYARDALLARFQFSGWDFGNLAGYPALHYYFPLPFILSAALSLVMPLTVALKIVTILCSVLLPASVYYLLRQMRFAFPTPILGAALTLPFLFVESQSMWGGNLLSMLAGEFSYSLGLQLSLVYFASYWRGSTNGTRVLLNAGLLALVALSHGCSLLVAGLFPLFHVLTGKDVRRDAIYYLKVNVGGFCLVAPWLLSWVAYSRYTSTMNYQWAFTSMTELFPVILAPTYLLSVMALAVTVYAMFGRPRVDRRWLYPWFGVLTSFVMFRAAYFVNVPDIRFIPYLQVFLGLAAAILVGHLLRRFRGQLEMAAFLVVACVVWTGMQTQVVHAWVKWNYEGVEKKPSWPILRDLTTHLKGGYDDPRIVYENSPAYDAFGTPRIFEMLPYFSGRATLEGAHLQGSVNSPFIFYIQSELSDVDSCPFPDYRCSTVNLRAALPRLDLFNVGTLLVRSDRIKQEARATPGLSFDKSFGPLQVYNVETTMPGYVRPLACAPVLYTGADWKAESYEWFLKYRSNSTFVAYGQRAGDSDTSRFARTTDRFPVGETCLPRPPACTASSRLDDNRIQIQTDCIGQPLLVKTSYHPRWQVRGAQRIYPITPGFMLVFPDQPDVELTYRWGAANYAGAGLAIGFVVCFLIPQRFRMQRPRHVSPAVATRTRTRTVRAILGATVATVIIVLLVTNRNTAIVLFSRGLAAFQADDFPRAKTLFTAAAHANPRSSAGVQSLLYLGFSHYKTDEWLEAADAFRTVAEQYPENRAAPEALYHVGLSYQRAKRPGFEEYFVRTIRLYPTTPWAGHARARLTEAGMAAPAQD